MEARLEPKIPSMTTGMSKMASHIVAYLLSFVIVKPCEATVVILDYTNKIEIKRNARHGKYAHVFKI